MRVGWHFVEDSCPDTLGAATYLDVGGQIAGQRSPKQMCRVYFKGKPDIPILAMSANCFDARIQFGNELNHPIENYPGTPDDYSAEYLAFHNLVQAPVYWSPPSPGFPNWQSWLDGAEEADGIVLHCYGSLEEMQAVVVYTVLRFPGKQLWIGECNFGPVADKYVDIDDWTHNHFKPFLDWCTTVPEVEAVTYFAYRWPNPDMAMGTPVDGAGTAIETVLREWREPAMADDPRIPQLLTQNAELTAALISHLKGNDWNGADSTAGHLIALTGKTLEEMGLTVPKA